MKILHDEKSQPIRTYFMQNGGRFWTNEILVGMGLHRNGNQAVTAVEASLDKNLHGKDFNAG